MTRKLAVIAAGGTGGHLYPAIATARELRKDSAWSVTFVVRSGDKGRSTLEQEGFSYVELAAEGMPRQLFGRWPIFMVKLIWGFLQALRLLRQQPPHVVVGMGGYVSVPVIVAARLLRIPTVVHEQNVRPGLANRWLGRWADEVAVSFPESIGAFPKGKAGVAGNPVRGDVGAADREKARAAWEFDQKFFTVLVFGGSQGARRLNELVLEALRWLSSETPALQALHISGPDHFEKVRDAYRALPFKAVVLPYCEEMAQAYAAADLVICRSGASTVSELVAARRPSFLVPYPHATDRHQQANAEVLKQQGIAEVFDEEKLTGQELAVRLRMYLHHPDLLSRLTVGFSKRPPAHSAADELARRIRGLAIPP